MRLLGCTADGSASAGWLASPTRSPSASADCTEASVDAATGCAVEAEREPAHPAARSPRDKAAESKTLRVVALVAGVILWDIEKTNDLPDAGAYSAIGGI